MKTSKKVISLLVAASLLVALAVPAFADVATDGQGALTPVGSGGEQSSTGTATIIGDSTGAVTSITGDDDNLAGAADTNGADINVWAKVLDSSTKIYKVDLAWGAMKFQFTSTAGQWNPETHTYGIGGGTAGWTTTGYVDGTNNKITVTNHSNNAVDATFAYAMENNAFNNASGADSVVGNFFADNAKALAAAAVLATTDTAVADKLADSKISLHTADAYSTVDNAVDNTNNVAAGARAGEVFFTFSGTPDEGKGANLNDFTKVGVITVTIAPNAAMADEYPAFVAA